MLKTAAGFHSANRENCAAVSVSRRQRLEMRVAMPRFLRPPTRIFSRRNPAAGTSLFSTPRSVPTKRTSWPMRVTSRATAIAGITCPPVPPPAITNSDLVCRSAGMFRNIEKYAERGQRHKKRTAAEADHGQRNTFGRHHAEHHADVEEGLDDQHGGDSESEVTAEFIGDQNSGADPSPENDHEAEQYGDRPEQAEFFADDGVDGVGVGFGQVEQFLAALHQADAHGATRSDGDLRLLGLVVRVF